MHFECPECGKTYDYGQLIWKCQCGSYINLIQSVRFEKANIKTDRLSMWRYDDAYPVKYEELTATYNEGMTPLINIDFNGARPNVKLDSLMPTGSFKDRGVVMVINYLKKYGADFITEDSSGNAAASVGAYCALAGMEARIFVPEGNSSGKIMQTAAYGAGINPISGTRDQVAMAAQQFESSYAGHNWHPVFCQGIKSIAYEIWEQLGYNAPDSIITPCGGGSLTLGIIKGFKELLENGEVDRLPKVYAVQPQNCNPIVRYFNDDISQFNPEPTIAEGTAIAFPVKPKEITEQVRSTNGAVIDVTEDEIKSSLKTVCGKGIYIEPTSAIAFAAFEKLLRNEGIEKSENTVIVASGNGLKAAGTVNEIMRMGNDNG